MPLSVVSRLNEWDTAGGDNDTTSGTVAFTAGLWYIAFVSVRKASNPPVPSAVRSTSGNNVFTIRNSGGLLVDPASGNDANISIWTTKATTTETQTIFIDGQGGTTDWTGVAIHVFEIVGADSSDVIEGAVATGTAGTGSTMSATLDAFVNSGDRPFAGFHSDGTTEITPESGWTAVGTSLQHANPAGRTRCAWNSAVQDTTVTATHADDGWGVCAVKLREASAQTVSVSLIDHEAVVFSPRVDLSLSFGLIDHEAVVFEPTVATSAQTVSVGLVDHEAVVFAPTVSPGNVDVSVPLVDHAATVFSPEFVPGNAGVSVGLIDHSAAVFAPTIASQQEDAGVWYEWFL